MLRQEQFAKFVKEGDPNFGSFDDNATQFNIENVNEYISCPLCAGYLINATVITECTHVFCKSCIIKHFNRKNHKCPQCNQHIPHPILSLKSDNSMQEVVYKLVPELLADELKRETEFWEARGMHFKDSKSHLLKIDAVQKMLGGKIECKEEDNLPTIDYNKCHHNTTVETNANFDGKIVFMFKESANKNNLPVKCMVVPIRLKMSYVKKLLAKVLNVDLQKRTLLFNLDSNEGKYCDDSLLASQVARLLRSDPLSDRSFKQCHETIVVTYTLV